MALIKWTDEISSPIGTPSWALSIGSDNIIYRRFSDLFVEHADNESGIYHIIVCDSVLSDRYFEIFKGFKEMLSVFEVQCKNDEEARLAGLALYSRLTCEAMATDGLRNSVLAHIFHEVPPAVRKALLYFDYSRIKQIEGPIKTADFGELSIFKKCREESCDNETDY